MSMPNELPVFIERLQHETMTKKSLNLCMRGYGEMTIFVDFTPTKSIISQLQQ